MNIPKDGGWGKPPLETAPALLGQGSSLLGRFLGLPDKWLLLSCLALTATFCFGLGLLAARENQPPKDPLWIEQLPPEELPGSISSSTPAAQVKGRAPTSSASTASPPTAKPAAAQTGQYVASKTGTKYYLPSCATAKRIKDENKVWFATKQQAEAAGYQAAANCKGL